MITKRFSDQRSFRLTICVLRGDVADPHRQDQPEVRITKRTGLTELDICTTAAVDLSL